MPNPEWRTSTVVALCESMRQLQDFSALPILADALEENGCALVPLLNRLREPLPPYHHAVRLVAYVMSDRTRAALKWLDDFIEEYELGYRDGRPNYFYMTSEALRAIHWHPTCDYDKGFRETLDSAAHCYGEYLTFEGNRADSAQYTDGAAFWDAYETVTGLRPHRTARFSCSC